MENTIKQNKLGDEYRVIGVDEDIKTDKELNMGYWDTLDEEAIKAIKNIAKLGGIDICDITDFGVVKDVLEVATKYIKENYPEAEFPYVDGDY